MFFLSYYPTHIIITIITTLGLFSNFTLILRVYETERPDSVVPVLVFVRHPAATFGK